MKCRCGANINLYKTRKGNWIGQCDNKHWQYEITNKNVNWFNRICNFFKNMSDSLNNNMR